MRASKWWILLPIIGGALWAYFALQEFIQMRETTKILDTPDVFFTGMHAGGGALAAIIGVIAFVVHAAYGEAVEENAPPKRSKKEKGSSSKDSMEHLRPLADLLNKLLDEHNGGLIRGGNRVGTRNPAQFSKGAAALLEKIESALKTARGDGELLTELRGSLADAERERDEAVRKRDEAREQHDAAREELAAVETQRDDAVRERNDAQQERDDAQADLASAEAERDDAIRERDNAQSDFETAETARDEAVRERNEAQRERDDAQADLETAEAERDEAVRERNEAQRERDDAQADLETAEAERDEAVRERNEAQRERDDAQAGLETAETARDEAVRERNEAQRERDDVQADFETAEAARDEAVRERNEAQRERDEARDARDAAQAALNEALNPSTVATVVATLDWDRDDEALECIGQLLAAVMAYTTDFSTFCDSIADELNRLAQSNGSVQGMDENLLFLVLNMLSGRDEFREMPERLSDRCRAGMESV